MKTTARMILPIGRARGRRGVALPVALVGLVAMSLLVTTALLTSTTESAISAAQAGGTRMLYSAEGGLNEVLRAAAVAQAPLVAGQQTVTLQETQQRVRVTTALLHAEVDPGYPNAWQRTYSLTAEPVDASGATRGRAVVAMIRQERPRPDPLAMNITSAITLGGDMHVNGNAFTVSGQFSGCGMQGGVNAVRAASESDITTNNNSHMNNFEGYDDGGYTTGTAAIERSDLTRDELAENVLNGRSVEEIIASVPLANKWGPRWHPSGSNRSWSGTLAAGENVAVIDANRGTVEVKGGSGVVIIVNGNMLMKGSSSFDGIIIVEGNFTLSGNPTLRGALVSLAMQGENELIQDDSSLGNGSIMVQYDKCKVDSALQRFGDLAGTSPASFTGSTFAWFEVVR